ncbi:hypothetical protein N7512_009479 [Penicillium capsulatum]|nr:hypothetical protein N7512_009479 [Penicillium capsulatum]
MGLLVLLLFLGISWTPSHALLVPRTPPNDNDDIPAEHDYFGDPMAALYDVFLADNHQGQTFYNWMCGQPDDCEQPGQSGPPPEEAMTCGDVFRNLQDDNLEDHFDFDALGENPENWRQILETAGDACQSVDSKRQETLIEEACEYLGFNNVLFKHMSDKEIDTHLLDYHVAKTAKETAENEGKPRAAQRIPGVLFSNSRPASSTRQSSRRNDPSGWGFILWTTVGPWICTVPSIVFWPDQNPSPKQAKDQALREFNKKLDHALANELKAVQFRSLSAAWGWLFLLPFSGTSSETPHCPSRRKPKATIEGLL